MYATMKQRTDCMPAFRHKRSQNAGVVQTLAEEVVPVDALMRISFRTESDATRGITAEQNIRGFRPMSAAMSACRNSKLCPELSRAGPNRNAVCGHRYGGRCPSLAFPAVSNLR